MSVLVTRIIAFTCANENGMAVIDNAAMTHR